MRPNNTRRSELTAFTAIGVFAVVILFVSFGSGHPADNPYLPKCPLHLLTGLHCPGCGATRAAFCLIHGQVLAALHYNPLFIMMLPVIALFIGKRLYELIYDTKVELPRKLPLYRLIAVAACVFFVLRNIPLPCFDWLRPPM